MQNCSNVDPAIKHLRTLKGRQFRGGRSLSDENERAAEAVKTPPKTGQKVVVLLDEEVFENGQKPAKFKRKRRFWFKKSKKVEKSSKKYLQ